MTRLKALTEARKRWGKTAVIKETRYGAHIGAHDEFVESYSIVTEWSNRTYKKNNPVGQYHCHDCNEYHLPKRTVTQFSVGKIMLGMFFEVRGSGLSWEDAFKAADAFQDRFKVKVNA